MKIASGWLDSRIGILPSIEFKISRERSRPRPTIAASSQVMAEEAAKMQLYGIETGFPVLYGTPPSDGEACSGGKIRVNESNSDLCPCLESEAVLRMVRLQVFPNFISCFFFS